MIRIATDSTCDLPPGYAEEHGIITVPINIQFGTDSYEDGITIDHDTFYNKIEELGTLPTTSQPSVGQFARCFRGLKESGVTDVVSLHVTAKLSGTFQSAQMTQEMMAGELQVHPFDSASGSVALGFMVMEASRMVRAGSTVPEILARMETIRERTNLVLTLKDLRFAQMSGRVGRLQSSLASLLNVKPIVRLEDGMLDVSEKVRSQGKAIERMLEIVIERVGTSAPVNLAVVHARVPEQGNQLLERAKGIFNCAETFVADLTTSLVVHFGPGTLGLVAYQV
jgi:DegV family protein with EDD domain